MTIITHPWLQELKHTRKRFKYKCKTCETLLYSKVDHHKGSLRFEELGIVYRCDRCGKDHSTDGHARDCCKKNNKEFTEELPLSHYFKEMGKNEKT
ncbi:hypothetical protein JXB31_00045 [Candidatus Woesearchaeota archaeon]|nr:hypothetical protein [Candidatus Woesearchaeota archaeon]